MLTQTDFRANWLNKALARVNSSDWSTCRAYDSYWFNLACCVGIDAGDFGNDSEFNALFALKFSIVADTNNHAEPN